MAANLRRLDDGYVDVIRERIKDAQDSIRDKDLILRLQAFALDEELNGEKVRMSKEQILAAKTLINKKIPDLKQVEHQGGTDNKLIVEVLKLAAHTNPEALASPALPNAVVVVSGERREEI